MTALLKEEDLAKYIQTTEDDSKFIVLAVDSHFNDKEWSPCHTNRVHWEWAGGSGMPSIPYTGTPFIFIGGKRLVCHQGKDKASAQKLKYKEKKAKQMMMDHSFSNQRRLQQHSKKVGCPAAFCITKIAVFPKFEVAENRERAKKAASKLLRQALERDPVIWETWYAVTQPSQHAGHTVRQSEKQRDSSLMTPVNTNNGIERQNETYKHKYLEGYKENTLSEMLDIVVNMYVPELHRKRYGTIVLTVLRDRPKHVVKHVMQRMENTLTEKHVRVIREGLFSVESESEPGNTYQVSFGAEDRLPSCQCEDWRRHKLPCKHFCAIFKWVPGWTWQQLPETYKGHPLLNLDAAHLTAEKRFDWSESPFEEMDPQRDTLPLPSQCRARKTALRTQCINLTKQFMDKLCLIEDEEALKIFAIKMESLVKDATQVVKMDSGMTVHFPKKKVRLSTPIPHDLPKRTGTGRPKSTLSD